MVDEVRVRPLTPGEATSRSFRALVAAASGADPNGIDRILATGIPALEVIGVVADGGTDAAVRAFAAVRVEPGRVVLRYLAVAEDDRGLGFGRAVVQELQRQHRGLPIRAETDDDAVGFYRALGFDVQTLPRDARWPHRQRYACVLPAALG